MRISFKNSVNRVYPNSNIIGVRSVWKDGTGWENINNANNLDEEALLFRLHNLIAQGYERVEFILLSKQSGREHFSEFNVSEFTIND